MTSEATTHAPAAPPDYLDALRRQDPDAFRTFYEAHVNRVYRYIFLRVQDAQKTEDLTAEVFLRAWKSIPSFKWRGTPLLGWLLRIAYNLVVDSYRKPGGVWTQLEALFIGKEDRGFRRIEDEDEIIRLFSQLNYEQQVVLYLNLYEGYGLNEIGDVLDKTPNAIRVIKHRAIKVLGQETPPIQERNADG